MILALTHKLTDETIAISEISEIRENDKVYYISGKYDPRSMETEPLVVSLDGIVILKTDKLQIDRDTYRNMKLFY